MNRLQHIKLLIPIGLLIATMALCFGSTHKKYQGTNVLKTLSLPLDIGNWKGQEVKQQLNLGEGSLAYLGDYQMIKYTNSTHDQIFITLLDAGNFHNPKLCFSTSGYLPMEMPDTEFEISKKKFTAQTIFFRKKNSDTLVMYWLIVDQQQLSWIGQKSKDLFYALLGKKRVGLIIRLDILTSKSDIKRSVAAAQDFIKNLDIGLNMEQSKIIFGK